MDFSTNEISLLAIFISIVSIIVSIFGKDIMDFFDDWGQR